MTQNTCNEPKQISSILIFNAKGDREQRNIHDRVGINDLPLQAKVLSDESSRFPANNKQERLLLLLKKTLET